MRPLRPALVLCVLALSLGSTPAHADTYTGNREVLNILPPGSNGNVDLAKLAGLGVTNLPNVVSTPSDPKGALATATPTSPAHFADQLEMYDALGRTTPGSLSDGDLTRYYKH